MDAHVEGKKLEALAATANSQRKGKSSDRVSDKATPTTKLALTVLSWGKQPVNQKRKMIQVESEEEEEDNLVIVDESEKFDDPTNEKQSDKTDATILSHWSEKIDEVVLTIDWVKLSPYSFRFLNEKDQEYCEKSLSP